MAAKKKAKTKKVTKELMMIQEQFKGAFRCVEVFKIGSRKR
jgi:hypothetical protein